MPLALRVADSVRGVGGGELALDGPGECLPECAEHVVAAAGGELFTPILELDLVQPVRVSIAERGSRVLQLRSQLEHLQPSVSRALPHDSLQVHHRRSELVPL